MKKFSIILFFCFLCLPSYAAHLFRESYYQNEWCSRWHGVQEYQLIDYTRVDCVTTNYAVEFDFAKKWAESIGQALHYGYMTGKKPAIVLIIEQPKDFWYYDKIKPLCKKYGITLWYMKSPAYYGAGCLQEIMKRVR